VASRPKPSERPTVVLLVRHGKTPTTGQVLPGRAKGLHLSDEGKAQAGDAPGLERTTETARPIAKALGLRVRSDRGLLECDFGEWTGAKLAELAKKPEWTTVQRNPSGFRFPGGESFLDMQTRMTSALSRLAALHPGQTVVAVSHADPIKAVVAQAAGTPLDLFQRLTVAPCSVSAIAYTGGGPFVLTVNSTASLQALAIA
jgi:probable phosphomutase (TIGR03848 family)